MKLTNTAFSPIALGETVCGESGVFKTPVDVEGDFDWYELAVVGATTITWSAETEFPAQILIFDGNAGCANPPELASMLATECTPQTVMSISADVGPGTYWLVIGPIGFTDTSACGTGYKARAAILCPADLTRDDLVGVDDFLLLLALWGTPDGDIDGNGTTDVDDFLLLLASWGSCLA